MRKIYLYPNISLNPAEMKKVLILGAGMVVKPMVEYLIHHGYHVTVASRTKSKADMVIQAIPWERQCPGP